MDWSRMYFLNSISVSFFFRTSVFHHCSVLVRGKKGDSDESRLEVGLNDLLNVKTTGRWWFVGSAYKAGAASASGVSIKSHTWHENKSDSGRNLPSHHSTEYEFSSSASLSRGNNKSDAEIQVDLLNLADSQRMNTQIRKTIFCIIMGAEDYVDCFEKLLKLNLSDQQERQVLRVLLQCCMQEKAYNAYYAAVLQELCSHNRYSCKSFKRALASNFHDCILIRLECFCTSTPVAIHLFQSLISM
jgi:nucleolar MIF4G domain-containing protein 1